MPSPRKHYEIAERLLDEANEPGKPFTIAGDWALREAHIHALLATADPYQRPAPK